MSKRAIPAPPRGDDPNLTRMLEAVREDLQVIMGHRGTPIAALQSNATTAQIITKINEIIDRLQ